MFNALIQIAVIFKHLSICFDIYMCVCVCVCVYPRLKQFYVVPVIVYFVVHVPLEDTNEILWKGTTARRKQF